MNDGVLKGKRVTVMGLGFHGGGVGTVQWLVQQGASVTVTDLRTEEELAASLDRLQELGVDVAGYKDGIATPPSETAARNDTARGEDARNRVRLVLGEHREKDFTEVDMVVRNPSVRADSEYLAAARAAGATVEMDSSLFFAHCPTKDIIGVTGSKGKTTCARAIEWVLGNREGIATPPSETAARNDVVDERGRKNTVAVGVDGVSPLGMLAAGEVDADTTVVFELSSWRLEALNERGVSPAVAVVTSIYKEHLNTYESFEAYVETKKGIWKYQDDDGIVILNADDAIMQTWESEAPGQVFWFSADKIEGKGIFLRDGSIWIRGDKEEKLVSLQDLPVQSEHERRNILPALLLGWQRRMSREKLREAIAGFKRLPHRLEVVKEVDGVTYVNDSAATMPDASIAALRAYAAQPVVLIAGGNDKALDFTEWGQAVAGSFVKKIVWLPGTITDVMQEAVRSAGGQAGFEDADSMTEAVKRAAAGADDGDVVLMSPGATSFGLFLHEFDRGEKFRAAVHELGPGSSPG